MYVNVCYVSEYKYIKIWLPAKSTLASISHGRGEAMPVLNYIWSSITGFPNHNHLLVELMKKSDTVIKLHKSKM